jgi:hypothetical protein
MQVLHVMINEKFTEDVSEWYNNNFDNGEHTICYLNMNSSKFTCKKDFKIPHVDIFINPFNVIENLRFLKNIDKYDYIILHSMCLNITCQLLVILMPHILNKAAWIAWGGDLYSWTYSLHNNLKGWIRRQVGHTIRNKISNFIGIFPPDCKVFKNKFPSTNANIYYAPYCGAKTSTQYQNYNSHRQLTESRHNNDCIYIQVGHNSFPTLNHMEALDALSQFNEENIHILLPLSYGYEEYGDKVQAYAENLFPGKVTCLRKMLPFEEYFALIKRIDIGVFDTERQCGLGNIYRMIFTNVKLYMPIKSPMYQYFNDCGVPIQSFESLQNESFEEFVSDYVITNNNLFMDFIQKLSNEEYPVACWKQIYDSLRESL